MEGGGVRNNSCLMGLGGENVGGGGGGGMSSMMMMPFMTTSPSPFSSNINPNSSTTNNNNSVLMIPNKDNNQRCYFMDSDMSASMKAKIMSHPYYPRLLSAYINCQKIGAPPEVEAKLAEAYASGEAMYRAMPKSSLGEDSALDQFMEAYCEMLSKYEQELSKPFKEAMFFLSRVESQFKALSVSSSNAGYHGTSGPNGLCEEDVDGDDNYIDPRAEGKELKVKLLRKYSGYLGGLKQEFMKKKKKGKLPKEARQELLDWWSKHHKWPYPSESQKLALAESTGLDQKQINNWFINQRKRHWKPSEDFNFAMMEGMHPHYYMNNILTNPYAMDCTSPLH